MVFSMSHNNYLTGICLGAKDNFKPYSKTLCVLSSRVAFDKLTMLVLVMKHGWTCFTFNFSNLLSNLDMVSRSTCSMHPVVMASMVTYISSLILQYREKWMAYSFSSNKLIVFFFPDLTSDKLILLKIVLLPWVFKLCFILSNTRIIFSSWQFFRKERSTNVFSILNMVILNRQISSRASLPCMDTIKLFIS